jgi:hypothetical protein
MVMPAERRQLARHSLCAALAAALVVHAPAFAEVAAPFLEEDFEDAARIATLWKVAGNDPSIASVASDRGASGGQSLALIDNNPAAFGRWISREFDLPPGVTDRGTLRMRCKVLHSITGKGMRLTVIFTKDGTETGREHLFLAGDSPGWSSGEFSPLEHEWAIPPGSTHVAFSFVSSSLKNDASGSCHLDDLTLQ